MPGRAFLGIDTSNYTTSAALFSDNRVIQSKRLLPVKEGQIGLRQSDAVFHHVQQLPTMLDVLWKESATVGGVGVSVRPRDQEGSYMPCFTVGYGAAKMIAGALSVPVYTFSHQAGHIMAALYSSDQIALCKKKFLAFHVSGGTTEALLVTPDKEHVFHCELVAASLDLKAGQAVDRVGHMLGLPFPAGPALEKLAMEWTGPVKVHPVLKGADCCLSGLQNQCQMMVSQGREPAYIARYCLMTIEKTLSAMTEALFAKLGELPLVFAGGVMSNSLIRQQLQQKFQASFAEPAFSSDNAAGIAVLAYLRQEGEV